MCIYMHIVNILIHAVPKKEGGPDPDHNLTIFYNAPIYIIMSIVSFMTITIQMSIYCDFLAPVVNFNLHFLEQCLFL